MVNPIIQMLQQTNSSANPSNNVMMQALGAMMRGESPQQFLKNLAKTNPQLQGLDLDNLDKTAEQLYAEKGEDINAAKATFRDKISNFMK